MTNLLAVKIFSENLFELTSENFTLYQALKILSESKISSKKIRKTSEYLAVQIENGIKFSSALFSCPFMNFDSTYISFIAFSEQTGNINETLRYLIERCVRKNESKCAIFEALVYPSIVISLILFLMVFFSVFGKTLPGMMDFLICVNEESVKNVLWSFVSILFVSLLLILFLFYSLNDNRLYEAFLAGGFLVESGVTLPRAVEMSASVAGLESQNGKALIKAKEGLEFGMDLMTAFCSYADSSFKREIEMALVMAEKTGREKKVLGKIAENIKKEDDRKRKLYLSLIEPAFIILTGMFLMEIVINIVLPVIADYGTSI